MLLTTNPFLQAQEGGGIRFFGPSVLQGRAGMAGSWSMGVWSPRAVAAVREQADEFWCETCFLLLFPSATPVHWIVMSTFRVGLPASSTQSRNSTDKPRLCFLSDSTQSGLTITRHEPFLEGKKKFLSPVSKEFYCV